MSDLERLGEEVARQRDAWLAARGPREQAAARFLAGFRAQAQRPKRRGRTALFAAAAVVAAATGVLFVLWSLRPNPPTAYYANQGRTVNVGEALNARAERAEVHFNDGSEIQIEEGGEARVVNLHDAGAQVRLTKGKLNVHIVHRPNTRWTLEAGPYRVLVTGTRFDMSYDHRGQRLALNMQEGEVIVSGGDLGTPLTLRAGQSVALPRAERATEAPRTASAAPEQDTSQRAPAVPANPTLPRRDNDKAGRKPQSSAEPSVGHAAETLERDSWLRRARAGEYQTAFKLANSAGFDSLAMTSSASELLVLADVARFSGHPGEARRALNAVRSRFTGSKEAATAAFQLGRLSGTSREAVSWFQRYLNERPTGSLAREASGRVMELLSKLGDTHAARRQAETYLARYPGGPHADFARKLLNR